jgi:hypothetical protein
MNKSIAWKIYAWFTIISTAFAVLDAVGETTAQTTIRLVNIILAATTAFGIYGYAYRKKFGTSLMWKVLIPIYSLYVILNILVLNPRYFYVKHTATYYVVMVITFMILVPTVVALHRYSEYLKNTPLKK